LQTTVTYQDDLLCVVPTSAVSPTNTFCLPCAMQCCKKIRRTCTTAH